LLAESNTLTSTQAVKPLGSLLEQAKDDVMSHSEVPAGTAKSEVDVVPVPLRAVSVVPLAVVVVGGTVVMGTDVGIDVVVTGVMVEVGATVPL